MNKAGLANNAGMTHQQYALHGYSYSITVFDSNGRRLPRYEFNTPIEACVPLPDALRHRIADVNLTTINSNSTLTVLQSTTSFAQDGIRLCGNLSELPAIVAVGAKGSPPPLPEEEIAIPDTGGVTPSVSWSLLVVAVGLSVSAIGLAATRRTRRRTDV